MTLSRVGHLRASRNGLILGRHLRYPQGFADSVTLSRAARLRKLCVETIIGAIIPALMHRIPSELRSSMCLGEISTRMGDLLGSPRVAPLFFLCRADPRSLNDAIPSRTPKGEPQWPHPRQAPMVPARLRG
ncbi:hypothetical protein AHAS_Ahas06G0163800 [Arachis hypogaea]